MHAIRQNLAFSLGVLGIAVGLTVVGILTPVTGALLHELSSIPVFANSARLIGVKTPKLQMPKLTGKEYDSTCDNGS